MSLDIHPWDQQLKEHICIEHQDIICKILRDHEIDMPNDTEHKNELILHICYYFL